MTATAETAVQRENDQQAGTDAKYGNAANSDATIGKAARGDDKDGDNAGSDAEAYGAASTGRQGRSSIDVAFPTRGIVPPTAVDASSDDGGTTMRGRQRRVPVVPT